MSVLRDFARPVRPSRKVRGPMTAATELHGVIDGMPDADYHSHPALSSSGARKLLPPSCPALYRHERDHPRPPKRAYDLGHAFHRMVLGEGMDIVTIDADDYKTKAAQQQQAKAYDDGKVPLLPKELAQVQAMVAALRAHPYATALLDPAKGSAEQSLFWTDLATGVPLRARVDFLPHTQGGRMLAVDLKSCASTETSHLRKAVHDYGYFQQGPFYEDGICALGLADDVVMVFVFVEKTPPHLVRVVTLEDDAQAAGMRQNRLAIEVFAECVANDTWPSHSDDIDQIGLPPWVARQYEES